VERLADVLGEVAVDAGLACAAAFQGRLTCVDAATGALRWTREWSAGSGIALDARNAYGADERSHVAAFARAAGASVWRNEQLANRKLTTPLPLLSSVAVGDFEGYLHLLGLADGGFVGRVRVDNSAITATPQPWADGLIVQTQGGTLARVVVTR
jgi:outer membrane protein assembly factor BamB